MKRLLLFSAALMLLTGCSSRKQIEQQLYQGNYDLAISQALNHLQSRKTTKRKTKFIGLLKQGFDRITKRDLDDIAFLEKDNNPANAVTIFEMYATLDARQRAIEPVLPLYIDGREITFRFNDYTDKLITYRNKASEYLYGNATSLLNTNDKLTIRKAYEELAYIDRINPDFKDVNILMDEAYQKGLDYVHVSITNQTQQIIPERLENELLDFNTYGLNDFWTVYHANTTEEITYDYGMTLQLRQINISPERVNERQFLRRKQIVDGWEYLLDQQGNVMQDSLGNDIKVDKIITARARLFEISQSKSAQVVGNVIYTDLRTNNVIDSFIIDSAFVFENLYANVRGDRRALTQNDRALLRNRPVPFPSNEQLVYDTGEDLKLKLKDIITSYSFRG